MEIPMDNAPSWDLLWDTVVAQSKKIAALEAEVEKFTSTNSRVMPCPAFSVRSSCFVTHDMNCGTEACEIPIRART